MSNDLVYGIKFTHMNFIVELIVLYINGKI